MIGTGDIGYSHGKAVVKLGGKVIGAYDINLDGLKKYAAAFDCDALEYDQIDEYVKKSDYVVICTPPSKRLDYVEKVLSAHVPLYMEKPVATILEDAQMIQEIIEKYDGKVIVGFAHRYRPAFVKLYEIVSSGMLGEPVNVFCQRIGPGPGFKNSNLPQMTWRTDPKLACGMTVESLSHEFNLITALCGPIKSIAANTGATLPGLPHFDNNSSITMRANCGAIASINASWSSDIGFCMRGYIGTKGTAVIEGSNMFEFDRLRVKTSDMSEEEVYEFDDSYDRGKDDVIFHVHEHFWDCLNNGAEIITPYAEGVKVLRMSRMALASSDEGKELTL